MTTFNAVSGYKPPRFSGSRKFHHMTVAEAQKLTYGDSLQFLDNLGSIRECRVSGAPKLWKTRPTHVKVPIKYGMYESGYAESYLDSIEDHVSHLVVEEG